MPFCFSPWTNLDISPQGDIAPCCKFIIDPQDQFNIQRDSLADYSSSAFLKEIKQDFLADQWPTGCVRCRKEEADNIKSKRQLDYDRWAEHYAQYLLDSNQWITASIAFGNTCNLKCITCGPYSSSRWNTESKQIYGIDIKHVKFYRDDFVDSLISQAPGIIHLDIPGGEPFLSGVAEQKILLKHYIDSGQAANISLHYTTNVTIFPDSEWWAIWAHFREIDIQLSIDGIDKRYEYIRHPANWSDTLNNTTRYIQKEQQLSNVRLSVSHTVSAYNIYYLDEFFSWCYNVGLPRPWLGTLHRPEHMRPTSWSAEATEFIIKHLSNSKHKDVHVWMDVVIKHSNPDKFDEFCKRLHQHDQYRGTDFKTTFPELAPYI